MTPDLLMPDPEEARFYGVSSGAHSEYRLWWSVYVMKQPEPNPLPAVIDGPDPELG